MMMRLSSATVVLCVSFFTSAALADSALEPLARALAVIDQLPTKHQLIALGADPEGRALLELAEDPARPAYVRIRAASFLAWFDSEAARAGLERLAGDERSPLLELRVQAIRAFAVIAGAAGRPKVEAFLTHRVPALRAAAARALRSGTTGAPAPAPASTRPR